MHSSIIYPMNLVTFISTFHKIPIDYDKAHGYQCVDLFRMYCEKVLNYKQPESVTGAREFWTNYDQMPILKTYFDRVQEGTTGDFIVYGATKNNPYGHIALIVGGVNQTAILFEQDGFTQRGAQIAFRTLEGALGFLRPKVYRDITAI